MPIEIGAAGTVTPPVEALIHTAKRNEARGYDSIWWPDHLMGWHPESIWTPDVTDLATIQPNPHIYLDPVACIAAAAVHTERVRLGTSVTEPIRRHPAMLANEWLTLDHLSKGRAILGIGAGEAENNTPYGIDFSRPVAKLEEALTIIRLLWENDEPVDFDGEFWRLRRAVVGMGPHTPGRFPPIWVGAQGPRMLEITGRLADGWLPTPLPLGEYAERLERIRAAARATGRDPGALAAGSWQYVVVDEDHEECHRIMDTAILKGYMLVLPSEEFERRGYTHPFGPGFHGLRDYIPTHWGKEETLKAIDAVPEELVHEFMLHGTPDDLVARVREYEAAGAQHMVLWNMTFLGDLSKVRESYQHMDTILDALKG